jgi:hypothetical protein
MKLSHLVRIWGFYVLVATQCVTWSQNAPADYRDEIAQLNDLVRTLREASSQLEPGSERNCIENIIRTLECMRRNVGSQNPASGCSIPRCVSDLTGIAVDFDDVEESLRARQNRPAPRVTGQGSSQTIDYEAGTATRSKRTTTTPPSRAPTRRRTISQGQPVVTRGASSRANTDVRTEAARCVAIESHPKPLQWVYADAEKHGLKEGCNGTWKSLRFRISNWGPSFKWANSTCPVTGTIVNSKGTPSARGCCAEITNMSTKYPAYYSVEAVHIGNKLPPKGKAIYRHSIYMSKQDTRAITLEMYVMWWEPGIPKRR